MADSLQRHRQILDERRVGAIELVGQVVGVHREDVSDVGARQVVGSLQVEHRVAVGLGLAAKHFILLRSPALAQRGLRFTQSAAPAEASTRI